MKRIGGALLAAAIVLGTGGPAAAIDCVGRPALQSGENRVVITNQVTPRDSPTVLGTLTCPVATTEVHWFETYSNGATFEETWVAEDDWLDFDAFAAGEPSLLINFIPAQAPLGFLSLAITCIEDGVENPPINIQLRVLDQFIDVPDSAFYFEAVEWARATSITTGTTCAEFSPDSAVTRWQMALFLTRLASWLGVDTAAAQDTFSDTTGLSSDKKVAIGWLRDNGITTGTTAVTFDPDSPVTRVQMALFLQRLATGFGLDVAAPPDTFSDTAGLSSTARGAVGWLAQTGITTGVGGNLFDPAGEVTRGQMATFLDRFDTWIRTLVVG